MRSGLDLRQPNFIMGPQQIATVGSSEIRDHESPTETWDGSNTGQITVTGAATGNGTGHGPAQEDDGQNDRRIFHRGIVYRIRNFS
ncbi:uncharacterized [Tachysurus ichikawai]